MGYGYTKSLDFKVGQRKLKARFSGRVLGVFVEKKIN